MSDYEWKNVELPRMMGMGMGPGPDAGTLYYLEVEKKWKVFIVEPPTYEDDYGDGFPGGCVPAPYQQPVRWSIAFEGMEIVCGVLKTVETSKRTALLILEALINAPPPEVPEKAGGFGMIVPGGGGGKMGH